MSAPFAFVPRSVKKSGASNTNAVAGPSGSRAPAPLPTVQPTVTAYNDRGEGKMPENTTSRAFPHTEDLSTLVLLALSDYSIWLNADLRRALDETCINGDEDAGFLPLSYLVNRRPLRDALTEDISEAMIIKALRQHAAESIEVRMRMVALPTASWNSYTRRAEREAGGYEVRRTDWKELRDASWSRLSHSEWDARIVYIENIPPTYRSVPGIARFTQALLSQLRDDAGSIQHITLPPHHLDGPHNLPKCKGFALVTLSHLKDCEVLLARWPWRQRAGGLSDDMPTSEKDAVRYGLRTLSKERWDKLNEQYLTYQATLIEQTVSSNETSNSFDDILHQTNDVPPPRTNGKTALDKSGKSGEPAFRLPPTRATTLSSPYPVDCLVFVRKLHSGTNKTTIRTLLSRALHSIDSGSKLDGIDYVDFSKGMDSCYLRLASPSSATQLVAYFQENRVVQAHGLDDEGRAAEPGDDNAPLELELMQGKKEDLYWEKVPEKVRRQAVAKVAGQASAQNGVSNVQGKKRKHSA
ncbi:hypothetical protein CONPUDRAFT_76635 [Coniophora puteana RWD-64-598 SS2]|uniref:XRRM domain-containing protein n=1 Tax=Coniophora puteana (strain RWD-64-598) TaxID=741705 RepID=A0A5M3MB14_CONPW|nr:uncharacterized protein CONPUDRAFT_76635 [Coniophora puteana RWD-64-598 SS2]EIW76247.1 hypothetical protein CONPUDRAFT_76635 [Coniophora puteana RWD-64-598 SS2]